MNINDFIRQAHDNAIEKGFYENGERNISELLMLIVSELGEAQEALRNKLFADLKTYNHCVSADDMFDKYKKDYLIMQFESLVKDTFEDELADTFIRLFDLCGYLHIDIEKHIIVKMEYNKTRPKKHNKEF